MTTYPIDPPAALIAADIHYTMKTIVARSISPFTHGEQVYVHPGQWWDMEISVLPGPRQTLEDVIAFLGLLNGGEGTFKFAPPDGSTPLGTATGTPIIRSASQSGQVLVTTGWTASLANILKAGDWLSIISGTNPQPRLYKNLLATGTDSGGVASLTLWPRIRIPAPASGATVTVNSAHGIWRLASNESAWDITNAVNYGITIAATEALNP